MAYASTFNSPTIQVLTTDGHSFKELLTELIPKDWYGETWIEFRKFAGTILTRHVRSVLGRPGLYTASQEYLARKVINPYVYQPETGSGVGAPLILTGRMYKAINVFFDNEDAILAIIPPAGGAPSWKALQFQHRKDTEITLSTGEKVPSRGRTRAERVEAMERYQYARETLMEYSLKWEHETKFFEQGVEEGIPDLERLFGQLVEWTLSRIHRNVFDYAKQANQEVADWLAATEGGYFSAEY